MLARSAWTSCRSAWKRSRGAENAYVSEAEARAARHEFFAREMRKRKMRLLWLAHQQDDIAETMLMRLKPGQRDRRHGRPASGASDAGGPAAPAAAAHTQEDRDRAALWQQRPSGARTPPTLATTISGTAFGRTVMPAWAKPPGAMRLPGRRSAASGWRRTMSRWRCLAGRVGADSAGSVSNFLRLPGKPRAIVRRALHRWLEAVRPHTDLSRQGFELLLAARGARKAHPFSALETGFAVVKWRASTA